MRKRFPMPKGKSKRLFQNTARPVLMNKRRPGLKRGGTRL